MEVKIRSPRIVALLLLTACAVPSQPQPQPGMSARPGEVLLPAPASIAEIERIIITRDERGGSRPDYSIAFSADGTVRRDEAGRRAGRPRSATLDTAAFHRLAQRMVDDGFFTWSSYQPMARPGSILIVIVQMTGHREKEIAGRTGPHWPLGQAIDSLANTLQWTEQSR